jgi:hypothetical protein
MRPSARKSMHVANQLTSLVSEITKIETAITSAHAAREEAEQRLYDICVEKLVVDGVLKKVVQSMFEAEGSLRTVLSLLYYSYILYHFILLCYFIMLLYFIMLCYVMLCYGVILFALIILSISHNLKFKIK